MHVYISREFFLF